MIRPYANRLYLHQLKFWLKPVDTIRLDTLRMLLGISFFIYMRERWFYAEEWLTSEGYHVTSAAIYYLVKPAPVLPEHLLPYFGLFLFGSTIAFIVGWKLRWTTWIIFFLSVYVTYVDFLSAYTLNKLFIVAFGVLAFASQGPYWSIDKTSNEPSQSVWPVRILQATLLIHYFSAGFDKAFYGDWLTNPYTSYSHLQGYYMNSAAVLLLNHVPAFLFPLFQWGALFFEISAPITFSVRALRPLALVWGFLFQGFVAIGMDQLIYFSFQMVCFYVLFIPDHHLHKVRRFLFNVLCNPLKRKNTVLKAPL